jgi:hypothetical protein
MSAAVSTLLENVSAALPTSNSCSNFIASKCAQSTETDPITNSQEKANLARIRDNQRRSRARRKEYLQELESRLRQCELQGIEASAEIQLAARRVADENRKLRILLNQNGVGDDNIDSYLQSSASPGTVMGQGFSGLGGIGSSAVQVLDHLLTTRKPCCADGNTGAPGPVTTTIGGGSRDSSSGSISTVQSIWDTTYSNQVRSQNDNCGVRSTAKAPQHQFRTPSSTVSRTGSAVSSGRAGSSSTQQQQTQQQQQQQQQETSRNRMSSLAPSMASSGSTATTTSQQTQSHYDFDSQASMLRSFHGHQHHQSHNNITATNQLTQAHTQSHPLAPASQSSQYIPTSTSNSSVAGTNSCYVAADMITSMAGGDPQNVRAELGCLSHGMDCEVDNQLVFNVMDRYAGQGIGL